MKIFSLALAILALCSSSSAQFRKYSNEFLNIGVGGRALGMGNTQVSIVQDATAGYWNPAGLLDRHRLDAIRPGFGVLDRP